MRRPRVRGAQVLLSRGEQNLLFEHWSKRKAESSGPKLGRLDHFSHSLLGTSVFELLGVRQPARSKLAVQARTITHVQGMR